MEPSSISVMYHILDSIKFDNQSSFVIFLEPFFKCEPNDMNELYKY